MKENHLDVTIKASYYTLNELSERTKRVWLVFHGYGQLAKYFIRKFEILNHEKNFIIAPQGLSKMYLEGHGGRVGASWMTREDRATEIENQHRYIQSILNEIGVHEGKDLIYFGFSQGVATLGRFAAKARRPFKKMILWAGIFPKGITDGAFNFTTGREEIAYYVCREDPFLQEGMIEQQNEIMNRMFGKIPKLYWYQGGHKVVPELLLQI